MSRYVFDCETNGLLDQLDTIHCLALYDLDTDELHSFADQPGHRPISEGLRMLAEADLIIGHNAIKFDVPAITKVYPTWKTKAVVRDTLVCCRVVWPEVGVTDKARREKNPNCLPSQLTGAHSLEAWGYRLGEHKGEYKGGWESWSPDMHSYMCQDVAVTVKLWRKIESKNVPELCLDIEHRFAHVIFLQEQHGFAFDVKAAHALHGVLVQRQQGLERKLQETFPPWWVGTVKTPTRDVNYKRADWGEVIPIGKNGKPKKPTPITETYLEGCAYSKLERVTFNPGSRQHVADRLMKLRGWKPSKFTQDGHPSVDDDILESLPYPEAKLLAEYFMVQKRLGVLVEGKGAWIRVEKNGRIHGAVNTNGTVSGRCAHSKPNLGNVPSVEVEYGKDCRALFGPSPGYVQVGVDASGIQLRALAHYMAPYDGGAYILVVTVGDPHEVNREAAGLPTRANAKTFIYAFIFGAGDPKIGLIVLPLGSEKARRAKGKELKESFLKKTPALGKVIKAAREAVKKRGTLKAIDGRQLVIRSEHVALNQLLQSAEAVIVKLATVLLYDDLISRGWTFGKEWAQVAHVHDEIQAEVLPHLAVEFGEAACAAIERAGKQLGFRCPLEGKYKIGNNWAECH